MRTPARSPAARHPDATCRIPRPGITPRRRTSGRGWASPGRPERSRTRPCSASARGYYYGPGQTEDQVQPIDSDRASRTLTSNIAWPINPAQVLGGYNINDPNLGYQPRAYGDGYTLPEKVLSYTASIQQELPGNAVLTVAYVGSQGRNLFLRSWTNGIVGVTTNPTTGAGTADSAVRSAVRADRLQDQRRHRSLRLAADHA